MEDLTLKNSSLKHELDHSHGLKKENTQLREELKITQL
jgi:cell shape-determining protein MreC